MEINICPRWLAAQLGLAAEQQPHFALLVSSLLVLASAPVLMRIPHLCLMRTLLGVPCPGCGVLHGLAALAHWRVREAWQANPAAFALAMFWAFQIAVRPVAMMWTRTGDKVAVISRFGSRVAVAFLVAVWVLRIP